MNGHDMARWCDISYLLRFHFHYVEVCRGIYILPGQRRSLVLHDCRGCLPREYFFTDAVISAPEVAMSLMFEV
jgi:hypothetical protein